jgi:flagellar motor switch protein FliN
MSSSQSSSSSSDLPAVSGDSLEAREFSAFADVRCPVSVVLGTGAVTVRQCLGLKRASVLRLDQSAGEDLTLQVSGVVVARGEIVIVEDSTALRLTEIAPGPIGEERT